MRSGWTVGAMLLLPMVGLGAQFPVSRLPIDSGRLVRFRRESEAISGRLLVRFHPGDSVMIVCRYPAPPCDATSRPEATLTVPARQLRDLEVQSGTKWGMGAMIGSLVGIVLGAAADDLEAGFCEGSCHHGGYYSIRYTVAFGLIGALFGSAAAKWGPAP